MAVPIGSGVSDVFSGALTHKNHRLAAIGIRAYRPRHGVTVLVLAELPRVRLIRGYRTMKRTEEQLIADLEIDREDPEDDEDAVLADMHALGERWADMRELEGCSAETCPLCGAEWCDGTTRLLKCPICLALYRRISEPFGKESE